MAISITTLTNDASVSKTFTEVGKSIDKSMWRNTTDGSSSYANTVTISQLRSPGRDVRGNPLRKAMVTVEVSRPVEVQANPSGTVRMAVERAVHTYTLTAAPLSLVMTDTDVKDGAAELRQIITGANVLALRAGEV